MLSTGDSRWRGESARMISGNAEYTRTSYFGLAMTRALVVSNLLVGKWAKYVLEVKRVSEYIPLKPTWV